MFETDEDGTVVENGLIAVVRGIIFDKDKILNDHLTLEEVADWTNGDAFNGMVPLLKSKIYKRTMDLDKEIMPLSVCYIERVYIYPKYRKQGFGKYIFENLCDIFEHCFNVTMHCFYIYPNPQYPVSKTDANSVSWDDLEENKGKMKKLMISGLQKTGYRRLGNNTEYYALNCAADTTV